MKLKGIGQNHSGSSGKPAFNHHLVTDRQVPVVTLGVILGRLVLKEGEINTEAGTRGDILLLLLEHYRMFWPLRIAELCVYCFTHGSRHRHYQTFA